jgi:hypothetical protein
MRVIVPAKGTAWRSRFDNRFRRIGQDMIRYSELSETVIDTDGPVSRLVFSCAARTGGICPFVDYNRN